MTIPEFWSELKSLEVLEGIRCSFPEYANRHYRKHGRFLTVGIDIFQWIFEHSSNVSTNGDNMPEADTEIHAVVSGIASKLRYMIQQNVNFVIVFDGTIKLEKNRKKISSGLIDHNTDKRIFEAYYKDNKKKIENNRHINRQKCVCALVELLEAWNISFIHAPGDAETELARLNVSGVIDAIISNDADSFAYGALVVLRNFSKFTKDLPASSTKSDHASSKTTDYNITPVDSNIIKKVNLDADKIMFIACLQGDDYSNGAKGLGIKKAWALATSNLTSIFDAVKTFKSIYVSNDPKKILQGKLPYDRQTRLELLRRFEKNLTDFLKNHGRDLLTKVYNSEVKLPSDFIIASHYYPLFAESLFISDQFSTGIANPDGKLSMETLKIPILPQPLSIIADNTGNGNLIIKRGNNKNKMIGKSILNFQTLKLNTVLIENQTAEPINWIDRLKYKTLLKWMQTAKNKKKEMEYLADVLGTVYFWRGIILSDLMDLKETDFFIKTEKTVELNISNEIETLYQLKFVPRKIFKKVLKLSDSPLDENLNKMDDEIKHVWLPRYYFEIEKNGREIFERYLISKSPPKKTPKSTPRKKKTPTQKSTLDVLATYSKSPIKIISTLNSNLLEMSGASIVETNKRNFECAAGSPKKRVKTMESIKITDTPNTAILKEPFEEDAEVSRILDTSDYVGSSFIDDNDFNEFYKDAKQVDKVEPTLLLEKLESPEIKPQLNSERVKEKKEHSKMAVTRNISLMDSMTRLPTVPGESLDKKADKISAVISTDPFKRNLDDYENDTFSSNDTMDILFPEDKIIREETERNQKENVTQRKVIETTAADYSDDTFSTHGSMEILFGGIVENDKSHSIKEEEEKPLINASQNGEVYIIDSDTETSVSDVGTLEIDLLTPIKKTEENKFVKVEQGKPLDLTNVLDEVKDQSTNTEESHAQNDIKLPLDPKNTTTTTPLTVTREDIELKKNSQVHADRISLPSNFDGSEIMLAENTDDEVMWVVPPKKENMIDDDIIFLS